MCPREYLTSTERYVASTPVAKRKMLGQYFTSASVVRALLGHLPYGKDAAIDVLEPACGTGEFLHEVAARYPEARMTGIEIEAALAHEAKKNAPRATVLKEDFFAHDFGDQRFDAVVGNPPYFTVSGDPAFRERFADVTSGRLNIFSAFVRDGLGLLKDGGYLAFVIPPSMNNGAYFEKLREFIVERADIEMLSVLDSDLFPDANQMVMLLVLRKGANSGRYVFTRGRQTIFSTDADYLTRSFVDRCSLHELGYTVRTGSVVWNLHKADLADEPKRGYLPLVWSRNVGERGRLELPKYEPGRGQYVRRQKVAALRGEAVVVNRITGKVQEGTIRAALVPDGVEFYAENHVNVVLPREGAEQLVTPKELVRQLNARSMGRAVNAVTGNTQLSKTELEWLLPLDSRER